MDEPLSNLDAKLRVHMRAEIASLQNELGVTTIYVTHDQVEAMTMGDRVAVMRKGELQQVAPPQELYERPGQPLRRRLHRLAGDEPRRGDDRAATTARSSRSLGSQPLTLGEEVVRRGPRSSATPARRSCSASGPRASRTRRLEPDTPDDRQIKGVVVLREPLGSEIVAHFEVDAPPALTEDVRELARDVGQESTVQAVEEGDDEDGHGRPLRAAVAGQERRRDRRRGRHERGAPVRPRDRLGSMRRHESDSNRAEGAHGNEIPINPGRAVRRRAGVRRRRLRRRRRRRRRRRGQRGRLRVASR